MDKALELASQMADNPIPMLRMTKDLLMKNAAETDLDLVQARETEYLKKCWTLPEHHEAVNDFLEKRPPDFRKVGAKS